MIQKYSKQFFTEDRVNRERKCFSSHAEQFPPARIATPYEVATSNIFSPEFAPNCEVASGLKGAIPNGRSDGKPWCAASRRITNSRLVSMWEFSLATNLGPSLDLPIASRVAPTGDGCNAPIMAIRNFTVGSY
jgi:hypothetical protein